MPRRAAQWARSGACAGCGLGGLPGCLFRWWRRGCCSAAAAATPPNRSPCRRTRRATPSASPSPTPPAMPAAAKKKTKAGAIAFVRHFVEAMKYAGEPATRSHFRRLYMRAVHALCRRSPRASTRRTRMAARSRAVAGCPHGIKFHAIENDVAFVDATVDYEAQTWIKESRGQATEVPRQARTSESVPRQLAGPRRGASALGPSSMRLLSSPRCCCWCNPIAGVRGARCGGCVQQLRHLGSSEQQER